MRPSVVFSRSRLSWTATRPEESPVGDIPGDSEDVIFLPDTILLVAIVAIVVLWTAYFVLSTRSPIGGLVGDVRSASYRELRAAA